MKTRIIVEYLLSGIELNFSDVTRLILESLEMLDELARGLSRAELITLMRRTLRAGVEVIKAETHTVTLETAAWNSVAARSNLRATSLRDLRHFVRRILRVQGAAKLPIRTMTTTQCRTFCRRSLPSSASSYVKGRAVLHCILAYGVRQEWCDTNPVAKIEVPKVQEKSIEPLAPAQVETLKKVAQRPEFRDMRLSLFLMLYGGIRPAEVSRLQERDFNREERQVIIRPQASKTGGGRVVPLRGGYGMWKNERIIPRNWQRKWRALRHAAGFDRWQPDACRLLESSGWERLFIAGTKKPTTW